MQQNHSNNASAAQATKPSYPLLSENYRPGPRHPIAQAVLPEDDELRDIIYFLNTKTEAGVSRALVVFTICHSARRELPYGRWVCEDGREVLFNREYQPIRQRINGVVSYADRNEFVENIVSAEMFYNDYSSPIELLTKHLGRGLMWSRDRARASKKSLLRCLRILREYTPKEHISANPCWSLTR